MPYDILFLNKLSKNTISGVVVMKISARNQFIGKVIEINEGAVNAIVIVEIAGGNKISSTISMNAVKDLGIKLGSEVTAIVKSTSVMLATE